MRIVKVYAAGKIRKNDWRNVRSAAYDPKGWTDASAGAAPGPIADLLHLGLRLQYVGPFFISCDHGGWHGPQTHGAAAELRCCDVPHAPGHGEVLDNSLSAIERADVVYARMDAPDAYGTLVELGYALRAGKPILVDFDPALPDDVRRDLWFAQEAAARRPPEAKVREALQAVFTRSWTSAAWTKSP